MSSLKNLYKRIRSVQSTAKVTKAMQIVSSVDYRNRSSIWNSACDLLSASAKSLASIAKDTDRDKLPFMYHHNNKAYYIIIGPDKSLCGGYASNLYRYFLQNAETGSSVFTIGNKINLLVEQGSGYNVIGRFSLFPKKTEIFFHVQRIVMHILYNMAYGNIRVIYPKFFSLMRQDPSIVSFLPIDIDSLANVHTDISFDTEGISHSLEYYSFFYISSILYKIITEVAMGESAARMTAMDGATRNSEKRIDDLRLKYNYMRQSSITNEIIEIISGSNI